jgi:hypothetical protein
MEKAHWLGHKWASVKAAKPATSSEARLIHYELAGRYNLNASSSATIAIDLEASLPRPISGARSHAKRRTWL